MLGVIARELQTRLGQYRGRRYHLSIRVEPSFDDVEEFSVVVYYRDVRTGESVQIARIDTNHGFCHFDRLYRRDRPKDLIDVDVWEAASLLETNWRRFAGQHDRVHGE